MGEFAAIESAVVGALGALLEAGSPLFAEVRAEAHGDRAGRVAALERVRTPAALVSVDGRPFSDFGPTGVRVYVLVAVASLRSAAGARVGDVDTVGVFTAAEQTTAALAGLVVGGRRLGEVEERLVAADGRRVVIEQVWHAETL
ncbi:MAG: hypothetical protein H6816_13960 [Phycisphaerales bacterium]|nr:hypothetical protein [Phycisphaerales bacterium]